jgi:16S rRNA (adenine1518-N6/adenine1519-N6)-dimethyltransferase
MQTLSEIKALLESHGLSPKKSLGQNFLIDHNLIRKLVDAAGVAPGDLVLEVGPGTGTLTEELLERVGPGGRVVACELDDRLAALVAERAAALPNGAALTVVHADCLTPSRHVSPPVLRALRPPDRPFALVANLPYGAATPLISALLVDHPRCRTIAVTVQREVADRLLAAPSSRDYGALSVIARAMAEVSRIAVLPRECFWPRPDVTSAMVLLRRRDHPLTADPAAFSRFCRVLFAHRRKQLGSVLAGAGIGPPAAWPGGIRPGLRAEQLSAEQIESLRIAVGAATGIPAPPTAAPHLSTGAD